MKKLLIITLFLTITANSQVTKKVLYNGNIYSFAIEKMNDGNQSAAYFYFTSKVSKNSTGMNIGIMTIEELKYFVAELRAFANYPASLTDYQTEYTSFRLKRYSGTTEVVIMDLRGGFLKVSKQNALSIATEIEKNIGYMK